MGAFFNNVDWEFVVSQVRAWGYYDEDIPPSFKLHVEETKNSVVHAGRPVWLLEMSLSVWRVAE